MPATDGDATPTSQTSQSSSLKVPEVIHLSGIEHLLHNAAQRRGQGEGATQAGVALVQAANHYGAVEGLPDDQKAMVVQVLKSLAEQFAAQGARCIKEQNVLLGQWMESRKASTPASKVPPPLPPVRIGWVIRAWRATVVPAWRWAFAK